MTTTAIDRESWRAAIGRGADRYLAIFERIEANGGRATRNWNWAAFAFSTIWFCYRRMWGRAFLNLMIVPLIWVATPLAWISIVGGSGVEPAFVALALQVSLLFVLLPLFVDWLYYRSLKARMVGGKDPRALAPSRATALGAFIIGVAIPGAVVQMSTSNFRDSAAYEQIGEGMFAAVTLQTEIKEFHERNARLPNATEAAALTVKPTSRWVKSVVYDSTRQVILVTMAKPFAGQRFSLVALVRGGELSWTCRNIDLPRALVRADCRD